MIWISFEILINVFESWLILYFIKNNLHIRPKSILGDLLCIGSCTAFYSSFLIWKLPKVDGLIFIFPFLYSLYYSRKDWQNAIFWIIHLAILFNSTAGMTTHLFTLIFTPSILVAYGLPRLLFIIFSNTILALVILSASKLNQDNQRLSWPSLLSFLAVSIYILIAEECLYSLQQSGVGKSSTYAFAYTALLFCSWLCILLFRFLTESSTREQQYKMEVSINSAALRHQEEFKVMYQDFITRQHDYKHTLQTLEMLIKQNNIREASNFLIEHTEKEEVRPFITGSLSVDALLTAKQLTMTKYGITLHFTTCPLNVLPLPTPDFCTLLGNVLDNSIEGIQRITDPTIPRVISLTLSRTYQMFHIICKNYCNPETLHYTNGLWISSKNDNALFRSHGYGISNIQNIVDSYEGHSRFTCTDNNIFCVEVTLSLPEPEISSMRG